LLTSVFLASFSYAILQALMIAISYGASVAASNNFPLLLKHFCYSVIKFFAYNNNITHSKKVCYHLAGSWKDLTNTLRLWVLVLVCVTDGQTHLHLTSSYWPCQQQHTKTHTHTSQQHYYNQQNSRIIVNVVAIIIRLHRMHKMRPITTDGVAVAQSVSLLVMFVAKPNKLTFVGLTRVGPKKQCISLDWDPHRRGNLGLSGRLKSIGSQCHGALCSKKSILATAKLQQPTAMLKTGQCQITLPCNK